MDDCIFCKIIRGDIPSTKVYEDENVYAFKDIHPAAPIHVLIVPKKHIMSLEALNDENIHEVIPIHRAIQYVTEIMGISDKGYRVIINCGAEAGQTVMHLHYHILGGMKMSEKII